MRDYLDRNYILRALRLFLLSQAALGDRSSLRNREDPSRQRG